VACLDENSFAAYFDLRLTPADAERLFVHVDTCADCARLFTATAAAQARRDSILHSTLVAHAGVTRPGRRPRASSSVTPALGRYVIDQILGMGGMGVVYAAHDPDLDRRVAIKLLRPDSRIDAGALRTRLSREAQAMARLSHPNVINVFEIGAHADQIFIVMELIDGTTLAQWLRAQPRTWREIVRVFVAAGEGLEAAHRAGIVHRDFKPDNVLVSREGRVCVTDFGLARIEREGPEAPAAAASPPMVFDVTGTQSGLLVGTPAYMAPEQMRGEPTDARSDLFSFCIALWEALYQLRPFEGGTLDELRAAIERGRPQHPKRANGPRQYRHALEKGLSAKPDERPASMGALLSLLRVDPIARARRRATAGVIAAAVAAMAIGLVQTRRHARMCAGSEERLVGVWDRARRDSIHRAFIATGADWAETAWRGVERALDDYSVGWVSARTVACEATRLRGTQSEELLDARMLCLDERLHALKAETDVFAAADRTTVEKAVSAAGALPPLGECADLAALRDHTKVPTDAATRARLDQAEERIAVARAAHASGHYHEGVSLGDEAVASAQKVGYRPVEGRAAYVAGRLRQYDGDNTGALKQLQSSELAAVAGGDDGTAASAWLLMATVEHDLTHYPEAQRALQQAAALLEHHPDPLHEAERLATVGELEYHEAHYNDAVRDLRQSFELCEKLLGPEHPRTLAAIQRLAAAESDLGHEDRSLELNQRLLAAREKGLGPTHPLVASTLNNIGANYTGLDRLEEALPMYQRALAIKRGFATKQAGFTNELQNIGMVLGDLGRTKEALSYDEEALRILERERGPDHPTTARARHSVACTLKNLGRLDEAAAEERRAIESERKQLGADSPTTILPLSMLGWILNEQHRPAEALPVLEQARALCLKSGEQPRILALIDLQLGRALWMLGRDDARAWTLVESARKVLADFPKQQGSELRAADALLAQHPRR
jgi:eukaryotic-like serine/threonine-protein kinase